MKRFVVLACAALFFLTSASVALAGDAADAPALPEHGSVWFGSGIQRFAPPSAPLNSHDVAMIRSGAAHNPAALQSRTVDRPLTNPYDEAMIRRGPNRGWMAERGIVQVIH